MTILSYFPFIWIASLSFIMFDRHLAQEMPMVVYNLADETPAGAILGNIAESLPPLMAQNIAFVLMTSRRFQYLSDFFRLTSKGDLITLKAIDRDNTNEVCGPLSCCHLPTCEIKVNVVVSSTADHVGKQTGSLVSKTTGASELSQSNIPLIIRINDANDNAPYFVPADIVRKQGGKPSTSKPFIVYLREGEPNGYESLPIAVDADSQLNGIKDYQLIELSESGEPVPTPSLTVTVQSSAIKTTVTTSVPEYNSLRIATPHIIQTRALDYEDESDREIHAMLLAIDGGNPPLTGSLSIVVHLIDINDNAPQFQHPQEEMYITISENTTLDGQPIFTLKATDRDSGDNGRVTYALSPLASADVSRKFAIDPVSGAIRIQQAVDYELYSERHFVIPLIAKDAGSPQRSATTSLFVKVRDINDNRPSLVVQENITVPEGELLTKPVIKFYIKDDDEISHGKVHCAAVNITNQHLTDTEILAGKKLLRLHGVSDTVFFVFMKDVMDYETTPRASLLIDCVDEAQALIKNTKPSDSKLYIPERIRITVAVQDRNDNPPQFLKDKYSVTLPEHSPAGTFVTQVKAIDADSGEYGQLIYQIGAVQASSLHIMIAHSSIQQTFIINANSGQIEVLNSIALDRELSSSISLQVIAKDKGGLSASAEVIVELTDINDCTPKLMSPTEFSLPENQRIDTVIGRLHIVDHDEGKNARIHLIPSPNSGTEVTKYIRLAADYNFRYAAIPSNGTSNLQLSTDLIGDGEVRALLVSQMPVDRETYAALFFELIAFDEGNPPRSVTSTITITIKDQNDNTPIATFPSADDTVGSDPPIYINSPIGSLITQLRANDPDQGENGTITFHLNPGTNGSDHFQINPTSGKLVTAWLTSNDDRNIAAQTTMETETLPWSSAKKVPSYPGIYLVDVAISDKGRPIQTRNHRFYIEVHPENPNLSMDSTYDLAVSTAYPLSSRTQSNKLLLITLIVLSLFTIISIVASCIWAKVRKTSVCHTSVKSFMNEQTDCHPAVGKFESNTVGYVISSTYSDENNNVMAPSDMYTLTEPNYNISTKAGMPVATLDCSTNSSASFDHRNIAKCHRNNEHSYVANLETGFDVYSNDRTSTPILLPVPHCPRSEWQRREMLVTENFAVPSTCYSSTLNASDYHFRNNDPNLRFTVVPLDHANNVTTTLHDKANYSPQLAYFPRYQSINSGHLGKEALYPQSYFTTMHPTG